MPYVFPHEDLFVGLVLVVLVGLVIVRVVVARTRRARIRHGDESD